MRVMKRAIAGGVVMVGLLALVPAAQLTGRNGTSGEAEAGALGPREAAALAVKYAGGGFMSGRLVSSPRQINAQPTTLGAARQLLNGRPIDRATKEWLDRDQAVWLVFIRGEYHLPEERRPGSEQAPSPDRVYHQMAFVLDAVTGQAISGKLFAPGQEIAAAASLPAVAQPLPDVAWPQVRREYPTTVPLPARPDLNLEPPGQPARSGATPPGPPPGGPSPTPFSTPGPSSSPPVTVTR